MEAIILPEVVAAGIYNTAVAVKNRKVTKPRKTTMFELELPIGEGGVSYIDDESRPIKESYFISAKPGQLRHTQLPYKCYYVHMILGEGYLYERLMRLPSYVAITEREEAERIFTELLAAYGTGLAPDPLLLQSRLLELIRLLCRHEKESLFRPKSSNKETIERVIDYISHNLSADLSLEALAAYASFSTIHFHNCFRHSTGKTLRDFVEEKRLGRAIELLGTTNMTLSEIAYECGFSSQAYFSYVFKRRLKRTPREYVKEIYKQYEK